MWNCASGFIATGLFIILQYHHDNDNYNWYSSGHATQTGLIRALLYIFIQYIPYVFNALRELAFCGSLTELRS